MDFLKGIGNFFGGLFGKKKREENKPVHQTQVVRSQQNRFNPISNPWEQTFNSPISAKLQSKVESYKPTQTAISHIEVENDLKDNALHEQEKLKPAVSTPARTPIKQLERPKFNPSYTPNLPQGSRPNQFNPAQQITDPMFTAPIDDLNKYHQHIKDVKNYNEYIKQKTRMIKDGVNPQEAEQIAQDGARFRENLQAKKQNLKTIKTATEMPRLLFSQLPRDIVRNSLSALSTPVTGGVELIGNLSKNDIISNWGRGMRQDMDKSLKFLKTKEDNQTIDNLVGGVTGLAADAGIGKAIGATKFAAKLGAKVLGQTDKLAKGGKAAQLAGKVLKGGFGDASKIGTTGVTLLKHFPSNFNETYNDAVSSGINHQKAVGLGLTNATLNTAIEKLNLDFGGWVKNPKVASSAGFKTLQRTLGEGTEEFLQSAVTSAIASTYRDVNFQDALEEAVMSGGMGGLTALIGDKVFDVQFNGKKQIQQSVDQKIDPVANPIQNAVVTSMLNAKFTQELEESIPVISKGLDDIRYKLSEEQIKDIQNDAKNFDNKQDYLNKYVNAYHGTTQDFDNFDYKKIGNHGTSEGQGFYFTNNREIADTYAKRNGEDGFIKEYLVDIKKPLSTTKLNITANELKSVLSKFDPTGDDYLSNWGDVHNEGYDKVLDNAVKSELEYAENDSDLISGIAAASGGDYEKLYSALYDATGYDGINIKNADWGDQDIKVAFNNDQLLSSKQLENMYEKSKQDDLKFKKESNSIDTTVTPGQQQEINKRASELLGDYFEVVQKVAGENIPSNAQGFTDLSNQVIAILDGNINTANHELVHGAMSRIDNQTRINILNSIISQHGADNLVQKYIKQGYDLKLNDDNSVKIAAEEELANGFVEYAQAVKKGRANYYAQKVGLSAKVKAYFDRVIEAFKDFVGSADYVKQFYAQLETGKFKSKPNLKTATDLSYKIINTPSGKVVEIENNILDGVSRKDYPKVIRQAIKDRFQGKSYEIGDTGELAKVTARTKKEIAHKQSRMNNLDYQKKGNMAGNLDELIQSMQNPSKVKNFKPQTKPKIDHYISGDVKVKIGQENFVARVDIEVEKDGEKTVYDIANIRKTSSVEGLSPHMYRKSDTLNIAQDGQDVNNKNLKYSLQSDIDMAKEYYIDTYKKTGAAEMRKSIIEALWEENKKGAGTAIITPNVGAGRMGSSESNGIRISNNNFFYSNYYKENGKPPTKKAITAMVDDILGVKNDNDLPNINRAMSDYVANGFGPYQGIKEAYDQIKAQDEQVAQKKKEAMAKTFVKSDDLTANKPKTNPNLIRTVDPITNKETVIDKSTGSVELTIQNGGSFETESKARHIVNSMILSNGNSILGENIAQNDLEQYVNQLFKINPERTKQLVKTQAKILGYDINDQNQIIPDNIVTNKTPLIILGDKNVSSDKKAELLNKITAELMVKYSKGKAGKPEGIVWAETKNGNTQRIVYLDDNGRLAFYDQQKKSSDRWEEILDSVAPIKSKHDESKAHQVLTDTELTELANKASKSGETVGYIYRNNDKLGGAVLVDNLGNDKDSKYQKLRYSPSLHYIDGGFVRNKNNGEILGNYIEVGPNGVRIQNGKHVFNLDIDFDKIDGNKSNKMIHQAERIIDSVTKDEATREKLRKIMIYPTREAESNMKVEAKAVADELNEWRKSFTKKIRIDKRKQALADSIYYLEPRQKDLEHSTREEVRRKELENFANKYGKPATDELVKYEKWMRSVYDNLLARMNEVRVAQGDEPIKRRNNYITHINEMTSGAGKVYQSMRSMFAGEAEGIQHRGGLPEQIAGQTEEFRPVSKWNPFTQKRSGADLKPTNPFNPLGTYASLALHNIHLSKPATNIRSLEVALRALAEARDTKSIDFKNKTINNNASFVEWLQEHGNILSGKTGSWDRKLMSTVGGKKTLEMVNFLQSVTGKALIAGNFASALVQPIVLAPAFGTNGVKASIKGVVRTLGDKRANAAFRKSHFMTERYTDVKGLTKGLGITSKVADALGIPMYAFERAAIQVVWNGAYERAMADGYKGQELINRADSMTSKIATGRSIGDTSHAFQNSVVAAPLMFTREVINQTQNFIKDQSTADKAKTLIALALMGGLYKKLMGRSPASDPLEVIGRIAAGYDKEGVFGGTQEAGKTLLSEALGNMPHLNIPAQIINKSLGGDLLDKESDVGRFGYSLPFMSPIDNFGKARTAYKNNQWTRVAQNLSANIFAGNQLRKTWQGNEALNRGYTTNNKGNIQANGLRDSAKSRIKATLFGPSGLKEQQDFYDSGAKSFSDKTMEKINQLSGGLKNDYIKAKDQERRSKLDNKKDDKTSTNHKIDDLKNDFSDNAKKIKQELLKSRLGKDYDIYKMTSKERKYAVINDILSIDQINNADKRAKEEKIELGIIDDKKDNSYAAELEKAMTDLKYGNKIKWKSNIDKVKAEKKVLLAKEKIALEKIDKEALDIHQRMFKSSQKDQPSLSLNDMRSYVKGVDNPQELWNRLLKIDRHLYEKGHGKTKLHYADGRAKPLEKTFSRGSGGGRSKGKIASSKISINNSLVAKLSKPPKSTSTKTATIKPPKLVTYKNLYKPVKTKKFSKKLVAKKTKR